MGFAAAVAAVRPVYVVGRERTRMSEGDLPAAARVGRTALVVSDLDELERFYRDVVGLTVLGREGDRSVLGAGETALLELRADASTPERTRAEAGLFHTAFRVPDRGALGDALARVRDHWHLGGASDHLVSEALYLTDPEGNGVEIYRDRPQEEWPTTDDGRVQMDTDRLDLDALQAERTGDEHAPDGTDVGHVHLEVTDLDAARDFYVDALGLGVRQAWGDAALFVAAGDYHHHVGLNTWNGRTTPKTGRGLDWFELLLPDEAALDATVDRLDARDVNIDDTDAGVAVTDPDGITVRLRVA